MKTFQPYLPDQWRKRDLYTQVTVAGEVRKSLGLGVGVGAVAVP